MSWLWKVSDAEVSAALQDPPRIRRSRRARPAVRPLRHACCAVARDFAWVAIAPAYSASATIAPTIDTFAASVLFRVVLLFRAACKCACVNVYVNAIELHPPSLLRSASLSPRETWNR